MRLHGRSSSHFTRVVRMFASELDVAIELVVIPDIATTAPAGYHGNPALKLPTLEHDGELLFGAEHICRKLVELAGRADDPRVVLGPHPATLVRNAQELAWHAMAAQVQLVVGILLSRLPPESILLAKAKAGLHGALGWIEERLEAVLAALPAPRDVSLFEVTLFCALEHIVFRPTIALDAYPRLRAFAASYRERPAAEKTPYALDPAT